MSVDLHVDRSWTAPLALGQAAVGDRTQAAYADEQVAYCTARTLVAAEDGLRYHTELEQLLRALRVLCGPLLVVWTQMGSRVGIAGGLLR